MPLASRALDLLVSATIAEFALFTAISGLGEFHWAAELLTHFRVQAAVAGMLLALMCALLRMPRRSAAAGGLAALHLFPVLPYVVPAHHHRSEGLPRLRLLQINVHTANRRHEAVEELVMSERPDILALLEVNRRWLEALASLHRHYPHRIERPQDDNFGIAVFSRFPIDDLSLRPLHHDGIYMALGRFSLGSTPVTLAVAHAVPPAGPEYAALRNEQLGELSEILRSFRGEIILLGDLNTSPWSPVHRRLERSTGLHNSARGFGLLPTWPAGFRPLMIPLDHCLLSSGLRAVAFEAGPEVGSDHLPVLVDIVPIEPVEPDGAQPNTPVSRSTPIGQ
jgi:endonuclease/exonuclease/phosphatase (EEP) superfamily protein YafD